MDTFLELLRKGGPLALAMFIGHLFSRNSRTKDFSYWLGVFILSTSFIALITITILQVMADYPKQIASVFLFLSTVFSTQNIILIGLAAFCVAVYRLVAKRINENSPRNFSLKLKETVGNVAFSGIGRIFLEKAKKCPPFIGKQYYDPLLQPNHEAALTEHFEACDFVEKNKSFFRGGGNYLKIKGGDTFESISEREYGDKKFSKYLVEANPSALVGENHPLAAGAFIHFPRIDVREILMPKEIEEKYILSQPDWIKPTLDALIKQHNLVNDEAYQLIRIIYDAAKHILWK